MIDRRSRFEALEDRAHSGELPMKPRGRAPNRTQLFPFVVYFLVEHALLDIVQRFDMPADDDRHRIHDPLDDGLKQRRRSIDSTTRFDFPPRRIRALQREATRADQKAFAQGEAQMADVFSGAADILNKIEYRTTDDAIGLFDVLVLADMREHVACGFRDRRLPP